MEQAWSIFELVVDLVCLLPPLGAIKEWPIPPHAGEIACFAAAGILAFSIIHGSIVKSPLFEGGGIAALVVAACVTALAFASFSPEWRPAILTSYLVMVMSLRFIEGFLIGDLLGRRPRLLPIIFAILVIGVSVYVVLAAVPPTAITHLKTGWSVLCAILASVAAATKAAPAFRQSSGGQELRWLALFLVFLSTILFVSNSEAFDTTYKFLALAGLPVGWLAACLAPSRKTMPDPEIESPFD